MFEIILLQFLQQCCLYTYKLVGFDVWLAGAKCAGVYCLVKIFVRFKVNKQVSRRIVVIVICRDTVYPSWIL